MSWRVVFKPFHRNACADWTIPARAKKPEVEATADEVGWHSPLHIYAHSRGNVRLRWFLERLSDAKARGPKDYTLKIETISRGGEP